MRTLARHTLWVLVSVMVGSGCGDPSPGTDTPIAQCGDGVDNDGDGMTDFPDDLGCVSTEDTSEDSLPSPKCDDGRDNDGDGKADYPADPGCIAPQADDETDDCPSGPFCPQCADGADNDMNGSIDYPNDPGCTSASDDDEFVHNPAACGGGLMIMPLPTTGEASGMLDSSSTSMVMSPCGGGGGAPAVAYELHLSRPSVVEVSTDDSVTTADTVIDIRGEQCAQPSAEIACNDDISSSNVRSKLTTSLPAGNYYIIISGHDSSSTGAYAVRVKTSAGEGTSCAMTSECGPGLVCRVPLGETEMVCAKPMCSDGVDDDGDGDGADYPDDPGCTAPEDNDETDDCPTGPNCPECGDDADNDGDGQNNYPNDTTCQAAGDSSESCTTTDGVTLLTMPATMGDTGTANDDVKATCNTSTNHTAADRTYRLDVPALTSLFIENVNTFDAVVSLYNSTCGGAEVACTDTPEDISLTNVAAGTYFYVVDGWSTGSGTYTINISGTIANGARCDGALAQSGALTCGVGYACKGTTTLTCQPALCGDNVDNDGDGKTDYPFDPGCDSVADDTEQDPATAPVCANGMDDDTDGTTDWPADLGCTAASGTTEVFCPAEVDVPTVLITSATTTGTTVGKANNFASTTCISTSGPDVALALSLPVTVQSLVIDTLGSEMGFDTVVQVRDPACAAQLACNDDGAGTDLKSKLTMSNVQPGNYAIIVDGFNGEAGAFTLNVKGTVAAGTSCSSPLFSGGNNAVLSCPMGTNCSQGTQICQ